MLRKDRRRASTDARLELRRQVVELRGLGKKMIEISAITGYARSYCSTLLKKLSDEPKRLEVLRRGGRPRGSKRALSAKDERVAQKLICGKFPDQLQLPFALWTRVAIRELICVRFGVKLSVRGVGEYLARWGYTPQKAARRAYERDDEAVRLWLQREYPKIVARAKREKAEICWGDETGVRSDESRHRGYARRGQTPIIKNSGASQEPVTDRGGDQPGQGSVHDLRWRHHTAAPDPVHATSDEGRKRKVFLILDNLNVHKARLIKDWLAANAKRIEVFYLPPYSPELNPSEYFNGDLKGAIQRGIPPRDHAELKRTILSHSRRIQKSPTAFENTSSTNSSDMPLKSTAITPGQ